MACCGDVPTLETLAAVAILREHLPDLKVRVVNVVDLMRLQPDNEHPHGLSDAEFDSLFTHSKPVVFAYHGYPWLIHRLTYRRTNHANLHVRGYKEEGTTTTPFDMVMLNDLDRFHLVIGRDRPRAGSRRPRRRTCASTWSNNVSPRGRTRASTATTCRRSATGRGPAERRPRRQRRLDEPQAERRRHARSSRRSIARLEEAPPVTAVAHRDRARRRPVRRANARRRRGSRGAARPRASSRRCTCSRRSMRSPRRASALPAIPHVAVFDTAFHRTIPERAATYALPPALARARAFGGTASTGSRSPGPPSRCACHASSSATSAAAARSPRFVDGRSVDTTMGFTPLEGVPMGTRAGAVDPGALLYLLRHGVTLDELEAALEHDRACAASPARATSPELLASTDPAARLALEIFTYRVAQAVAAMAVQLSAGSTRSSSPAASASTPRPCAQRSSRDSASSVSSTCESSARERMSSPRAPRGASFRLRSIGR